MGSSIRRFLLILGICIGWALISLAPIYRYLSPAKATIAGVLGVLGIALGMLWLARIRRPISTGWFLLLFVGLTAAFTVLYPLSLKHTLNSGSDREDALHIELTAIHQHQNPYAGRTFLGNLPTPLPGAMRLAEPFFALGHIAWQNILWLALFFVFTIYFFRNRGTALFFLAVFLLFAPSNLSDLTSGGDYLTNFFYIAIAVALLLRSLDRPFSLSLLAALFLGVTLSSRAVYIFVLMPLFALALQRVSRSRAIILFAVILVTSAAITLPVFMPHPIANLLQQLAQNSGKLRYLPAALHPQATLPLLAILLSCIAFFVRMNISRVFLIFSLASCVILAPPIVSIAIHMGKLPYECSYLAISVLSFSLWALARYESLSLATPNPASESKFERLI